MLWELCKVILYFDSCLECNLLSVMLLKYIFVERKIFDSYEKILQNGFVYNIIRKKNQNQFMSIATIIEISAIVLTLNAIKIND